MHEADPADGRAPFAHVAQDERCRHAGWRRSRTARARTSLPRAPSQSAYPPKPRTRKATQAGDVGAPTRVTDDARATRPCARCGRRRERSTSGCRNRKNRAYTVDVKSPTTMSGLALRLKWNDQPEQDAPGAGAGDREEQEDHGLGDHRAVVEEVAVAERTDQSERDDLGDRVSATGDRVEERGVPLRHGRGAVGDQEDHSRGGKRLVQLSAWLVDRPTSMVIKMARLTMRDQGPVVGAERHLDGVLDQLRDSHGCDEATDTWPAGSRRSRARRPRRSTGCRARSRRRSGGAARARSAHMRTNSSVARRSARGGRNRRLSLDGHGLSRSRADVDCSARGA